MVNNGQATMKGSDISFKKIFELVPYNSLILKPDSPIFTIVAVSESYLTATLTERGSILGRPLFEVFPDNPDDPEATGVKNLTDSLNTVIQTKAAHRMTLQKYDVPTPEGSAFEEKYWSPLNIPVLNNDGQVDYIIHTVEDVTENIRLQKSEKSALDLVRLSDERLHNLFSQAPVAIAIFGGPHHVIEFANEYHLKIWGRTLEQVINKTIFEAMPEVKGNGYEELLKEIYVTGKTYYAKEHSAPLKRNGKLEMVFFNFVYHALRDPDGKITGIIAVANEITELINSRNELKKINDHLSHSNQELEEFIYSASHDLQEPLRKIQTFSDLVKTRESNRLTPEGNAYLSKIASSAKRMNDIIKALLNYAHSSSKSLDFELTDLNEIVRDVQSDLELLIEQKHVTITSGTLPRVKVIPFQISQFFYNTIHNSIKFAKPSVPPDIHIGCRHITFQEAKLYPKLRHDSEYYEIRITDNGIGFHQKYADQAFSLFQQLNARNSFEGTGIGLAICKKIAINHHGIIRAESEVGKGTSIILYLPVSRDHS
jgi:PAS domain S-box-containing protein